MISKVNRDQVHGFRQKKILLNLIKFKKPKFSQKKLGGIYKKGKDSKLLLLETLVNASTAGCLKFQEWFGIDIFDNFSRGRVPFMFKLT